MRIKVTIKGMSPLLMHSFPMETVAGLEKKSPEDQAEHAAYRDPDTGELYVPGMALSRAIVNAGAFSKGKGRSSLTKSVAACLFVYPERVSLGVKKYVVDSRPVVISATRGRIIRHRPRLENWQLSFEIEYDDTLLKESEVKKVVDDCGSRVGILDFRPEKKGPFGRFIVTEWKPA